jgi:putative Ca2+/H+ antiporter (TMEM165/GDT1 family)
MQPDSMTIHWPLFLSVFSFIFVAELPDKTAFAILLLATRSKPLAVFLGVALAFVVQSAVAITLGSVVGLLPEKWVHLCAGLMFFAFAWHSWFHRDEEEDEEAEMAADADEHTLAARQLSRQKIFWRTFAKAFTVIFIAEWGDITQLATATFAAKYHHDLLTVFLAAVLALWAVTALAVVLGHRLKHLVHMDLLKKLGTLVFIMAGGYFLYQAF